MGKRKPELNRESLKIGEHERALAAMEAQRGKEHRSLFVPICQLSELYVAQGRFDEAAGMVRRAIGIQVAVGGKNHPEIANTIRALATLYSKHGKYAEAEAEYRRAIRMLEIVHGTESHISMEQFLDELCQAIARQNRPQDTILPASRLLEIQRQHYGPDDVRVAHGLRKLGQSYFMMREFDEAEELFLSALTIREKLHGPDDEERLMDLADLLHDLASVYWSEQRWADAEPLYRRALDIWEKNPATPPQVIGSVLDFLGQIRTKLGDFEPAESLLLRALAIRDKSLGRDHKETGTSLNNLATMYLQRGEPDKAEPLFLRSLAIGKKTLGPDHPSLATTYGNLGTLYGVQKNFAQAEPLLRKSIELTEKAAGPPAPELALCLRNHAIVLRSLGQATEADEREARAREIESKNRRPA
jgi:tetratricopeptide (TPR) repeat protein